MGLESSEVIEGYDEDGAGEVGVAVFAGVVLKIHPG